MAIDFAEDETTSKQAVDVSGIYGNELWQMQNLNLLFAMRIIVVKRMCQRICHLLNSVIHYCRETCYRNVVNYLFYLICLKFNVILKY